MPKNIKYDNLDKRYLAALISSLEERKKNRDIDIELYDSLIKKYTHAYEIAEDKSTIRDGFVTLEAIAPDPETIRNSVKQLLERILALEKEQRKIRGRFSKLDELLAKGNVSENVYLTKKKEYEILVMKLEDQKQIFLKGIPDSLSIIQEMNIGLVERIEEVKVDAAVTKSKTITDELKKLEKNKKDITYVAKEMSKLVDVDFDKDVWVRPTDADLLLPPPVVKAEIKPLSKEVPQKVKPEPSASGVIPPPDRTIWVKWKRIKIGKLMGEISLVGGNFAVIATDRPSLAIIRDIAVTGPSRLRSSTNPKVIEDRLKKLIKDKYNVSDVDSLLPQHLIRFAVDNKVGVDLFKLINSYFASVGSGAVTVKTSEALVNDNAQILTLAENVNLLGRRVLTPDRQLIGVIHELYYDPTTSHLYTFAFKGVPPAVIRRIYRDSHNRTMTDGTFSEFRNEISKKLSIPIYEALTPSSILRYSLMSGLVHNLNQLATLVESMNPRVSKVVDISSISSQGVMLSRYPQNSLPRIQYVEY